MLDYIITCIMFRSARKILEGFEQFIEDIGNGLLAFLKRLVPIISELMDIVAENVTEFMFLIFICLLMLGITSIYIEVFNG